MKIRYLLLLLLAASAQPAFAGQTAAIAENSQNTPAKASGALRAEDLRRVAETMVSEGARSSRANLSQAVEALKAQAKNAPLADKHADQADCKDCPQEGRKHPTHSASEAPTVDCILCIDRPASV